MGFLIWFLMFTKGGQPNYYPAPPLYQPAPWVQTVPSYQSVAPVSRGDAMCVWMGPKAAYRNC